MNFILIIENVFFDLIHCGGTEKFYLKRIVEAKQTCFDKVFNVNLTWPWNMFGQMLMILFLLCFFEVSPPEIWNLKSVTWHLTPICCHAEAADENQKEAAKESKIKTA